MRSWNSSVVLLLFSFPFLFAVLASGSASAIDYQQERMGKRVLMSFKEISKGSNRTFDCSPSGPCVPCLYSEKGDKKYRCSETGYRIPFKCVETYDDGSKAENKEKSEKSRSNLEISVRNESSRKHRSLLDDSSASGGGVRAYTTYRSCITAVNEEKLSVLGFEGIIFGLLLISGSVVLLRRKPTITMPGVAAGRTQANSRF